MEPITGKKDAEIIMPESHLFKRNRFYLFLENPLYPLTARAKNTVTSSFHLQVKVTLRKYDILITDILEKSHGGIS